MKRTGLLISMIVLASLLAGCATPTPEVIEKVVEKVVTQVVKETVKETVVVEGTPQVVEKEVTKVVEKLVTVAPEKWTGPGFGGVLHVVMGASPPTLDSPTTTEVSTQMVSLQINETLVAMSESYKVVPMLAESWDVSDDGKTYTFHLRQGIKFHNGEEMTAEDVVASFDRFMEVSARASTIDVVESRETKDEYTVVFNLSEPNRTFLKSLAYVTAELCIQPKSIIEGKAAGELKVPDEIIGTGPYKLKSFDPDALIVLERFEDYQPLPGPRDGMAGGKIPYVDEIHIHIVPDNVAQMLGAERGDYHVPTEISAEQLKSIENNPDFELSTFYPGYSAMILFNHAEKFTGDVEFRQAVLAVLDMEEVGLYTSGGDRQLFRLSPYLWPKEGAMYLPNDPVAEEHYNQNDVDKAKQLLEESGYQGEELVWMTTRDWEEHYLIAVAVSDQLTKKLGLNIKVEVYDAATMIAKGAEETGWNFTVGQYGSYNFFPLVLYSFWNCESTSDLRMGYCNPELDAAFDASVKAVSDEEEEMAFREVQRIFWEDLPNIKMYEVPNFIVTRKEVKNFAGWYRNRFFGVWLEE